MAKKSIIDTRKFVPEYFGNNREFQVFLRLFNLALSSIKSDSDNFVSNLLNPLKCKARLLPLLANYVGYNYNPKERIVTNRWITKLYPLLVRNRGSEIGIALAISLAVCLMNDDFTTIDLDRQFSLEYEEYTDEYGRTQHKLNIYTYFNSYIPIMKDLIEVVRPAGLRIDFISTQHISSSETVVLTDEYAITKYDYITGKLLSINDIDVYVKNSWDVLVDEYAIKHYKWKHLSDYVWGRTLDLSNKDVAVNDNTWGNYLESDIEQFVAISGLSPYNIDNNEGKPAEYWNTTGIKLVDGKFYDSHGNDLNRYVDPINGHILYADEEWKGEYVKDTRIYKVNLDTGEEEYTGMYFDVSNPAKIMNTCYKLLDNGVFTGYFLNEDNKRIYDSNNKPTRFYVTDYVMIKDKVETPVWKVCDYYSGSMYQWHINLITRKFEEDTVGKHLDCITDKIPFTNITSISKRAYLMKVSTDENNTYLSATQYYVNKYGDIIDPAGNVILSKKDRYKISDSSMIGFSEIHNYSKKLSTFDGTNILQRQWSYMKDEHIPDSYGKQDSKLIEDDMLLTVDDPRIKFDRTVFDIGNPVREYTGTELIRFLSNDELSQIKLENDGLIIPLFITNFDSENASGVLKINVDLPINYSLADVFKTMNIRFENKIPNTELNPKWDIYIDWVANEKNKSLFNLNDLPNPIHFIKRGCIEPRTLHWTGKTIHLNYKIYDGSTTVYTTRFLNNNMSLGQYQDVINETENPVSHLIVSYWKANAVSSALRFKHRHIFINDCGVPTLKMYNRDIKLLSKELLFDSKVYKNDTKVMDESIYIGKDKSGIDIFKYDFDSNTIIALNEGIAILPYKYAGTFNKLIESNENVDEKDLLVIVEETPHITKLEWSLNNPVIENEDGESNE